MTTHSIWWKAIINAVLRTVQRPFTERPWLVVSKLDGDLRLIGYGFCRVLVIYD